MVITRSPRRNRLVRNDAQQQQIGDNAVQIPPIGTNPPSPLLDLIGDQNAGLNDDVIANSSDHRTHRSMDDAELQDKLLNVDPALEEAAQNLSLEEQQRLLEGLELNSNNLRYTGPERNESGEDERASENEGVNFGRRNGRRPARRSDTAFVASTPNISPVRGDPNLRQRVPNDQGVRRVQQYQQRPRDAKGRFLPFRNVANSQHQVQPLIVHPNSVGRAQQQQIGHPNPNPGANIQQQFIQPNFDESAHQQHLVQRNSVGCGGVQQHFVQPQIIGGVQQPQLRAQQSTIGFQQLQISQHQQFNHNLNQQNANYAPQNFGPQGQIPQMQQAFPGFPQQNGMNFGGQQQFCAQGFAMAQPQLAYNQPGNGFTFQNPHQFSVQNCGFIAPTQMNPGFLPNYPVHTQPIQQPNQMVMQHHGLAPQRDDRADVFQGKTREQQSGPTSWECAMTLNQLPDLNGSEGIDKIKSFFKKFAQYTADWPNKKRISALETKLSGRAERAFNAAVANELYIFSNIRRAMLEQFEQTDFREMGAFDELMSGIVRKSNETMYELADRVASLVHRAYPGLTQHLADEYSIKHFIRSLVGNSELALSLEMSRRPGMCFDEFVALASRAEVTQRAAKRTTVENARPTQNFRPRENFFRGNQSGNIDQQDTSGGQFGRQFDQQGSSSRQFSRPIVCFNCDEPGHISRECNKPRRDRNSATFQHQNSQQSNFSGTGANRTPIDGANNSNNRTTNYNGGGRSQNFLKQNCIVMQEEVFPDAKVAGLKQLEPEVIDFLKNGLADDVTSPCAERKGLVGKMVAVEVSVLGVETKSMLDGGAQISLIGGSFFYKLVNQGKLDLQEAGYTRSSTRILDVNGRGLECYGVVTLPILRKGCQPIPVCCHITNAPFGFDLLFGTNALSSLGFCLYDEPNHEMIDFESVDRARNDLIRVIYKTVIQPRSQLVELSVGDERNDQDVKIKHRIEGPDLRIDSIVGTPREGKILDPATNFSSSWQELDQFSIVGEVHPLEETEEFGSILDPNSIFTVSADENFTENQERVAEIDQIWKGNVGDRCKNVLNGIRETETPDERGKVDVEGTRSDSEWIKVEENTVQLGTIAAFSDGEEGTETAMDVDPEKPFNWDMECRDHRGCSKLVAADLDPVLDRSGIGLMEVLSPMKALLTVFLLKSGAASSASAAKKLVHLVLRTASRMELVTYIGGREDSIKSGSFPGDDHIETAMAEWIEHCDVAKNMLRATGFRPITIEAPKALEVLPEAEREGFRKVFERAQGVLEKVRAKTVHKRSQFVEEKRVIMGDSSAKQLMDVWRQSAFIGGEGPISEVIRTFDSVALASTVKWLIVMAGKDSLMAGETTSHIMERIDRLLAQCAQFAHVKVFWLPPPFVKDKAAEYEELIRRMRERFQSAGENVQLITTADNGRSFLEIFRYGSSYNSNHVAEKGWMTDAGLGIVRAWLSSQVPGFPGNREIGVRAVKSAVRVPTPAAPMMRGGPGDPSQSRRHSSSVFHPPMHSGGAGTGHRSFPTNNSSMFRPTMNSEGAGTGHRSFPTRSHSNRAQPYSRPQNGTPYRSISPIRRRRGSGSRR